MQQFTMITQEKIHIYDNRKIQTCESNLLIHLQFLQHSSFLLFRCFLAILQYFRICVRVYHLQIQHLSHC